ncbi:MAG TPA: acetyl-CoA carboxylase biotin carboxylase subunit [Pyrinomonadaceae bacterium]|nr:acetyl-CoA carboxylase biotin carboxylase subunit [Pyrinomonadaceae bacterium]
MFRKILIANRGEIAVRIIRACRDLSISPVAVFSEVDSDALHVRLADEAYPIGPAPSIESYLNIDRILEAALRSGAEAVHPGYGFLAENASFARAVTRARLAFIGPPAEAMELMGSKTSARRVAIEAGVPVVPGTTEPLRSFEEARETAARLGYPVMFKASAGGGGKGMRLVPSEAELASAFETAQSEAAAAFGDSEIYLEKAIERPRHIEIQVFADAHGQVVHLGERECSIQRRHQKVIEECPSPIDDAVELRARMGEAAISVTRAVSYQGAGTVEFLVADATRDFYFLEMNTRLQVEHPVTELVTGIDLVREQIMVAAGRQLSFTQADIGWRGHAIECRVYAEDPEQNFLPAPGHINALRVPAGPGIRDDGGITANMEISIYYDPMISKLAAWGRTRSEAIDRLRRALDEYTVAGIKTTLPFFREVVRDTEFIEGRLDTGFIERFFARREAQREAARAEDADEAERQRRDVALVAAALDYARAQKEASINRQPREQEEEERSQWRLAGRAALLRSRDL